MKKSVKTQFYGLIFLKQQLRFIPDSKSGVNNRMPIRRGILNNSGIRFKTFSASFYDYSGNLVGKPFLLQICHIISFLILSSRLRQRLAAFEKSNLIVKRLMIPSYG